jgi:hypothetical protein
MKFQLRPILIGTLLTISCFGCINQNESNKTQNSKLVNVHIKPIEVKAIGMTFEAPDSTFSGLNTFRFTNESGMVHFFILAKLPKGKGIEDHQAFLAPVFQNIVDQINGKEFSEPELGVNWPDWFSEVSYLGGGPGLLSPGQTTEISFDLLPGTYVMECYVKTNGIAHSYNPMPDVYGMAHELLVTTDKSEIEQPKATLKVNISAEKGFEFEGTPTLGKNVVEVNFVNQKAYENFLGHDIHLVKLNDSTNFEKVANWMNWASPEGLETPAPAQFLGGANEMPAGSKAYFSVNLVEGKYAWISEIPDPESHNMFKRFTIEN